jgi:hypothetical protein
MVAMTLALLFAIPQAPESKEQMADPKPIQTDTQDQQASASAQRYRPDKTPHAQDSAIQGEQKTERPYYGWDIRRTTPYERWYLVGTGLIVIVTATYAGFAILQWCSLRSSVDAQKLAMEHTRKREQRELRAYVVVEGATIGNVRGTHSPEKKQLPSSMNP